MYVLATELPKIVVQFYNECVILELKIFQMYLQLVKMHFQYQMYFKCTSNEFQIYFKGICN